MYFIVAAQIHSDGNEKEQDLAPIDGDSVPRIEQYFQPHFMHLLSEKANKKQLTS